MVAAIIFPYIGRRLAQARGGRKASKMREGRIDRIEEKEYRPTATGRERRKFGQSAV